MKSFKAFLSDGLNITVSICTILSIVFAYWDNISSIFSSPVAATLQLSHVDPYINYQVHLNNLDSGSIKYLNDFYLLDSLSYNHLEDDRKVQEDVDKNGGFILLPEKKVRNRDSLCQVKRQALQGFDVVGMQRLLMDKDIHALLGNRWVKYRLLIHNSSDKVKEKVIIQTHYRSGYYLTDSLRPIDRKIVIPEINSNQTISMYLWVSSKSNFDIQNMLNNSSEEEFYAPTVTVQSELIPVYVMWTIASSPPTNRFLLFLLANPFFKFVFFFLSITGFALLCQIIYKWISKFLRNSNPNSSPSVAKPEPKGEDVNG